MPHKLLAGNWQYRLSLPIAILAGLCYPLAFAPYYHSWLLLVSIALLWWLLSLRQPSHAFKLGWFFGLGQFGLGVSWVYVSMHAYGGTGAALSGLMTALFVMLLALFPALTCWLAARLSGKRMAALVFIASWLLLDWARGSVGPGFPWLYAGYAVIDTPLAHLAAYGGIWLVTLATIATGLVFGQLLTRRFSPLPWILTLACWVAAIWLPTTPGVTPTGARKPVALVQANIPQTVKWQLSQQQKTRAIYARLTHSIANKKSLVIWSESSLTEFYRQAKPWLKIQAAPFADAGGALIAGLPRYRIDTTTFKPTYFNSIVVVGGGEGVYNKQKLVPFGEYVPFADLIRGLIPFFNLPMSSFTAGGPHQANLLAQRAAIAPFVCYDILFPDLVARQAHQSNALLEVSDDAWFDDSAAPWQHFQMARMRSIETGRYLLRDTNNGITAIINAQGGITAQLPQFSRGVLNGSYQPMTGETPFMSWGRWLTPAITALLFALGLLTKQ